MNRRQFIATSIAAGAAAVAGCVGTDETDQESPTFPTYDRPAYSNWIPAASHDEGDGVFFTHLDWEAIDDLDDDEDPAEDDDETAALVDHMPILGLPLYGAMISPLAVFGIMFYPFAGDVLPEDGEAVEGVETRSMTWTDDVLVFHGEYDREVFAAEYATDFDADERDGFTLYVGTDGFADGMAYAVSEDALVVGMNPGEDDDYRPEVLVTGALDRNLDEVDRVVDTDDGQWLFETTGEAPMAFGVWNTTDFTDAFDTNDEIAADTDETDTPETDPEMDDNPVFDNVESLVNNLVFAVEDGEMVDLEARFSAIYPDDAVPSEDDVREHLIGEADIPHEIVVDGPRVHASATFDEPPS